jgi:hypothetical protein
MLRGGGAAAARGRRSAAGPSRPAPCWAWRLRRATRGGSEGGLDRDAPCNGNRSTPLGRPAPAAGCVRRAGKGGGGLDRDEIPDGNRPTRLAGLRRRPGAFGGPEREGVGWIATKSRTETGPPRLAGLHRRPGAFGGPEREGVGWIATKSRTETGPPRAAARAGGPAADTPGRAAAAGQRPPERSRGNVSTSDRGFSNRCASEVLGPVGRGSSAAAQGFLGHPGSRVPRPGFPGRVLHPSSAAGVLRPEFCGPSSAVRVLRSEFCGPSSAAGVLRSEFCGPSSAAGLLRPEFSGQPLRPSSPPEFCARVLGTRSPARSGKTLHPVQYSLAICK